jgi:hypothetical protein
MYQQLWGYKVEDKLYLGVCEQKRLNTSALGNSFWSPEMKGIKFAESSSIKIFHALLYVNIR